MKGLKRLIVYKLEGVVPPEVMQDIDKLIDAAEKVAEKGSKDEDMDDSDIGANRPFISPQLIEKHDLKHEMHALKLAGGNEALSRGTCKLAFECHDYKATVPMMA